VAGPSRPVPACVGDAGTDPLRQVTSLVACVKTASRSVRHRVKQASRVPPQPPDRAQAAFLSAGGSGGSEELPVPDLLYALLLIGSFALLVLTLRGLERL
jgi:hypothetical protein